MVDGAAPDVLVRVLAGVVTVVAVSVEVGDPVAEMIIVGTEESEGFAVPAEAESTVERPSLAVETATEAAESALWTEAERALRGTTGTGMCTVTEGALEAPDATTEAATLAADATFEAAVAASEIAFEATVAAGVSAMAAEPATLLEASASWEAAPVAAEEATAGVGAMTLTGAMVTGPVGMDALAGSCIEVV